MSKTTHIAFIHSIILTLGLSISFPSYAAIPDLGDPSCESLLLVSNWTSNNVKIFDGCSGQFIRDLDSQNLINGPLGILQAPNNDILLVSENNGRLLRWDFETLSQGTIQMGNTNDFIAGPSGAVIGDDGFMYAVSYTQNRVVKINTQSWQVVDEILAANNGLIRGIDAGPTIYEGHLYLPGYDSDNILKISLANKSISELVSPNSGGLNTPRTIIIRNNDLTVTAERGNAVMVFDLATGHFKQTLIQIAGPTGMQPDGDNHFIINTNNAVFRVSNDGSSSETIVSNGAGGLNSGTFVYRLYKTEIDSDGDGLTDDDETNQHGTDPNSADTDGDSLSDGDEINTHGTNPLLVDTENDGMPDNFEVNFGLAATEDDAAGDLDADGLSNLDEFLADTLPNNNDTDGDSLLDGDDSDPLTPNFAPEIAGTPNTLVDEDSNYQFQPSVTYMGNLSTISFSISNMPAWASFNETSGELSGLPANGDVGVTSEIEISATNGFHLVPLAPFDIEVVNVNDAPEVTQNIPNQQLTTGQSINLDLSSSFYDVDAGDSLTFTATGLLNGFELSSAGRLTGVSTISANANVEITATDLSGESASTSFALTVNDAEPPAENSGGGSIGWLLAMGLFYLGRKR